MIDETEPGKQKPISPAQTPKKSQSKQTGSKKSRKIAFKDGAFQTLLSNKKIKGYLVLLEDNLSFKFIYDNGEFEFRKAKPPENVLGLRRSTLPKDLLNAFSRRFSSLATRKKEFYFQPSSKLKTELRSIKKSKKYEIFHITSHEEVIHAD